MHPLLLLKLILTFLQLVETQESHIKIIGSLGHGSAAVDVKFSSIWDINIVSTIKSFVNLASKTYLPKNSMTVLFTEDENFSFKEGDDELFILLTIARCSLTWKLHYLHRRDNILQIALTEPDCPRLPKLQALTIPLMNFEEQLSQMVLDLRTENVLGWDDAVIVHDSSISSQLANRIVEVLSEEIRENEVGQNLPSVIAGVLTLNKDDAEQIWPDHIMSVFKSFTATKISSNFLCFLKSENVGFVLEVAQLLQLLIPQNQWMLYVMDPGGIIDSFAELVTEGGNVAFMYSIPKSGPLKKEPKWKLGSNHYAGREGMLSMGENGRNISTNLLHREIGLIMFMLAKGIKELMEAEYELFSEVSEEEWEALKPRPVDHHDALLSYLKEILKVDGIWNDNGSQYICCPLTEEWRAAAVESWGLALEEVPKSFDVATWNPKMGLLAWDHIFPHVHQGFRGKNVQIATYHQPPWNTLFLNESGSIVQHQGLIFDVLDELARTLNFSYTLLYQKASGNGIYLDSKKQVIPQITDKPKNYSILVEHTIEAVRHKKAMIGAAAYVASSELKQQVNLTVTVAIEKHAYLTSRPQILSRALIFMAPFSSDTWLCIAISVLIMGPVLYWIHNLSPYYEYYGLRNIPVGKNRRRLSITVKLRAFDRIWKCVWYVYGALLQQGGIQVPMADSGRIVIGTWWLVVIVVMTTYCGNLVAFLTFPSIASTISSTDELIDVLHKSEASSEDTITLGIIDEAVDKVYLKDAADSRLAYLSSKAEVHEAPEKDNNRSVENRILERVRNGKHILIARHTHLLLLAEEDYLRSKRCDFYIGAETFLEENLVMIVAQNSPYLSLINNEIKKMHEGGFIQKWISDSLPRKGLCKEKPHEKNEGDTSNNGEEVEANREVTLDDMQGSFFVLFIGFFLALIAVSLECIWYRRDEIRMRFNMMPFVN